VASGGWQTFVGSWGVVAMVVGRDNEEGTKSGLGVSAP
jgi:hypothetical protein